MLRLIWRRTLLACAFPATAVLAGCDDAISAAPMDSATDRVAVVVNRGDGTLNVIPFGNLAAANTVPLGVAGKPASVAAQGPWAAVPMGGSSVAIVNLESRVVERSVSAASTVLSTTFVLDTLGVMGVAGAEGSLVAFNPATGRVAPPSSEGGIAPVAMIAAQGRLYVLNGRSAPDSANGALTVLNPALRRFGTVTLSGEKPIAMAMYGSLLFVLHVGNGGEAESSVSIVDPAQLRETSLIRGFGASPSSMAFNSRGDLYVSVPGKGVIVYSTTMRAFVRGPENPLAAQGLTDVARVVADPAGFVYALRSGACDRAGMLVRLDTVGGILASAPTGVCPTDVAFTSLVRQ